MRELDTTYRESYQTALHPLTDFQSALRPDRESNQPAPGARVRGGHRDVILRGQRRHVNNKRRFLVTFWRLPKSYLLAAGQRKLLSSNAQEQSRWIPASAGMTKIRRGWQPRQPHPGARIIHYRCCLPALAGFANYRRERTNGAAIRLRQDRSLNRSNHRLASRRPRDGRQLRRRSRIIPISNSCVPCFAVLSDQCKEDVANAVVHLSDARRDRR